MRAWSITLCLALVVVVAAAVGCPPTYNIPTDQEPTRIYLNLAFSQSCGVDPRQYDTSCLGAVALRVNAADSSTTQTKCAAIAPPDNLDDLVNSGFSEVLLGTLSDQGKAYFEVRGLHTKSLEAGQDVCANPEDRANWLWWGRSEEFDLGDYRGADAGSYTINVLIDCRDCEQGCINYGTEQCPLTPLSYCVPGTANLSCDKPCERSEDCYESAVTCDTEVGRCDPTAGVVLGQLCAPCMQNADCDEQEGYACVGRLGDETGICAPRCPDNQFKDRCPKATSCRRLYDTIWPIGVESVEDAGPDPADAGCVGACTDAGPVLDAGVDAGLDAGVDAGVDAGLDAGIDAGLDAGADAGLDAGADAGVDAGLDGGAPDV